MSHGATLHGPHNSQRTIAVSPNRQGFTNHCTISTLLQTFGAQAECDGQEDPPTHQVVFDRNGQPIQCRASETWFPRQRLTSLLDPRLEILAAVWVVVI